MIMKARIYRIVCMMLLGMVAVGGYAQQYGYAMSWKKYQYPLHSSAYSSSSSHCDARAMMNRTFFNVDWQVNGTIGNDFAGSTSGWGAHFEAGYYLTEHWAMGAFLGFHTNNEYFPRQSFVWEDAALSTDQQHSLFQLPFGLSARYRFCNGLFAPYAGLKLGAQYAESENYLSGVCVYNNQWGFYVSPEVGVEIHPFRQKRFGFHLSVYYNYATNDNSVMWYEADGLHNYGLRLGVAF